MTHPEPTASTQPTRRALPDEAQFDALADRVADAFRDGDMDAADRLFCELFTRFVAPDMRRRLRFFVWDAQLREEVWSRVIDQIYARRLRIGKPVYRRYLSTIYRRAVADEHRRELRHASRAQGHEDQDELDALVHRARSGPHAASDADRVASRTDIARVVDHFAGELGRPQWALVLRAMLEHGERGTDVAAATGMTQVRVRQIKMEIGRYLRGPGRGMLEEDDA
jgi:hypothetical protein